MKIIVTSVRNEDKYILEWISYHKSIGFDKFIFYTNDNTDETLSLLKKLNKNKYVEVYENKINYRDSPQRKAFSKAFLRLKELKPTWVACLDVDEYLILNKHSDIGSFLQDYDSADAIAINWHHYGSSGQLNYVNKPIIDRFKYCSYNSNKMNRMVKSIFKFNNENIIGFGPHRPWFKEGYKPTYIYPNSIHVPEKFWKDGINLIGIESSNICHDIASINHYAVKSKNEYIEKINRGNGMKPNDTSKHFNDNYFKLRDLNDNLGNNLSNKSQKMKFVMMEILSHIEKPNETLTPVDVSSLKNAAIILEKIDINISKSIMEIVEKYHPNDELIKSKSNLYNLISSEIIKSKSGNEI